jgi:spore coat polysaccharide biosynthesis protein SpsF
MEKRPKVGIILLARMKSSRLLNKHSLKINGRILLDYLLERLKKSKEIDEIILATTFDKTDDVLEELAKKENIKYFRGEIDDVLDRVIKCAEKNNLDIIVRITGDSPFIEPEQIDRLVKEFRNNNYDYLSLKTKDGVPIILSGFGLAVEVVSLDALKKAYSLTKNKVDLEHVTPFIYKNPQIFKVKFLDYPKLKEFNHNDLRLTVDFQEDLENMKEIIENQEMTILDDILAYLKSKPELIKKMKKINNSNIKRV